MVGAPDEAALGELHRAADEMTQRAAGRLGDARPASVSVRALSGFVVKELVDASKEADLVVLGTRSVSGLARLLVGSVSAEVIQHSLCPVVIVPHKR